MMYFIDVQEKKWQQTCSAPGPAFFNDFTEGLSYMKIVVIVEFSAVLEPDNFWPRLAPSHTDEYNFVAQDVFVVKVGGFCDFSSLGMAVVFLRLLVRVLAVWRRPHLAVGRVPALFLLADSQLVIGADPRSLGHFSLRWRTSIMGHCNSIHMLFAECGYTRYTHHRHKY